MKSAPRVSEAEWTVLKTVLEKQSCTAQDVIDRVSPATKWSTATVKTLLNRLLRKGALRFEKTGKSYVYSPAFSEEEFRAAEADSFLHRVFDGSFSPMIAHFARSRRLSRQELDALEDIVRQGRKSK